MGVNDRDRHLSKSYWRYGAGENLVGTFLGPRLGLFMFVRIRRVFECSRGTRGSDPQYEPYELGHGSRWSWWMLKALVKKVRQVGSQSHADSCRYMSLMRFGGLSSCLT